MNNKLPKFLLILFLIIGIFYFFFRGLALAKGVLAPIFLAIILAMMLVPVATYPEKKGVKKGWAAFFSDLIFVIFILGTLWAIGMEVQRLTQNWSSIEDRLNTKFSKVESFVEKNTGFSMENPFAKGNNQQGGNKQADFNSGNNQQLEKQQSMQQSQQPKNKSGTYQQQGNQQKKTGR